MMRRLLPLLVCLTVAGTALAQPAFGCVSGMTAVGTAAHDCCPDQPGITTSPVPVCCVVSQPVRDRGLIESRDVNTHQQSVAATLLAIVHTPDCDPVGRGASPPPPPTPSAVPIYLQQLALLI